MATVSDSPRSSSSSIPTTNEFRRNSRNLPAPWANIVRGESESSVPAAVVPSSSTSSTMIPVTDVTDSGKVVPSSSSLPDISAAEADIIIPDNDNGNGSSNNNSVAARGTSSKKPAWNKPPPSIDAVVEVSPVMGAVSWPALSDAAKASPKSSSDSLKTLPDGSASQGNVVVASSPKKLGNANPNLVSNHTLPARQKSMKRGGGGGGGSGAANGGHQQHPPPSPLPMVEMPHNNSTKTAPLVSGTSPRDHSNKSHNWEGGSRTGVGSQSHGGNEHSQPRSTFRRGGHHRGDGNNHYGHGNNRREHDRAANHDSNPTHRVYNGNRDGHMQQRVPQRNFVRPMPPSTAPFVNPQPIRPFGNPLGFPADMPSPVYYVSPPPHESLRGVPYFHPAPFMIVPAPDPTLPARLANQIEYYFSPENLCKDIYLRKYMDGQGWVSISIIANFNRVKQLATNIQFILDSVRSSTVVEVQGDQVRKRNDWMNWILLPSQPASAPDTQSSGTNHDVLANRIQSIGLEGGNTASGNGKDPADAHRHASSAEDLYDQSKDGEGQEKLQ